MVRHGCSTYSSPPAARSSTPIMDTAVSTSHAPFASQRTRPAGPSASRTASSRSMSAGSESGESATFTFTVRQPDDAAMRCASAGPTAGTVALTGIRPRTGSGQPTVHASSAAVSQDADSASSYSSNAENSPQPAGPSISMPSRTSMPRNRVVIGIANVRAVSKSIIVFITTDAIGSGTVTILHTACRKGDEDT